MWATLITRVDYLTGLATLDYSLKQVKSAYPLVAFYTDRFPEEGHAALDRRGIAKRHIKHLAPAVERDYANDARFEDTWNKLSVFSMTDYERVILIDSDMLVRKNMDELMDIELDDPDQNGEGQRSFAASHACTCNPLKKPHYPPDWIPSSCGFTSQHNDPDQAQVKGALSSLSHCMPNSGLVVVRPSAGAFDKIMEQMKDEDAVKSYVFPDQGVLVDVFQDRWVSLPYVYNALRPMRAKGIHDAIWRDDEVKNIHYIISPKPWDDTPEVYENPVFAWWLDANAKRLKQDKAMGIDDGF